jgi:hypothetical protein
MSVRLALCAVDGVQIAPCWVSPRFVSRGGDLIDFAQIGAQPTLAWAYARFDELTALAAKADADGNRPLGRLYARDALSLYEAARDCARARRAAGWTNPEDADRPYKEHA